MLRDLHFDRKIVSLLISQGPMRRITPASYLNRMDDIESFYISVLTGLIVRRCMTSLFQKHSNKNSHWSWWSGTAVTLWWRYHVKRPMTSNRRREVHLFRTSGWMTHTACVYAYARRSIASKMYLMLRCRRQPSASDRAWWMESAHLLSRFMWTIKGTILDWAPLKTTLASTPVICSFCGSSVRSSTKLLTANIPIKLATEILLNKKFHVRWFRVRYTNYYIVPCYGQLKCPILWQHWQSWELTGISLFGNFQVNLKTCFTTV